MKPRGTDYHVKKLIEHLNKTLFIENTLIDRLLIRIDETPIEELKQRLIQHLEETHKQKNILEQIILKLEDKSDQPKSNLSQMVSGSSSITKENSRPSIKPSACKGKINSISEETEKAKIIQDYLIEYDEFVAYDTLILIAEMTDLSNKNDIIQSLKESMQEEKSIVNWYQVHTPNMLDDLWPKTINGPIKRGQNFLLNHFGTKMPLVIMYADMVDSTNISMTLSIEDLVLLIRAFTHEISNVVERYNGYVLKYVGDAVISFFPYDALNNKYQVCRNSVECARTIIEIIKKEINSVLNKKNGYPELLVKIGIDEGENAIIQYGFERKMPIDILGYGMNVTSKITSNATANSISLGENAYNLLDGESQSDFQASRPPNNWKYINRTTKKPYRIYELK